MISEKLNSDVSLILKYNEADFILPSEQIIMTSLLRLREIHISTVEYMRGMTFFHGEKIPVIDLNKFLMNFFRVVSSHHKQILIMLKIPYTPEMKKVLMKENQTRVAVITSDNISMEKIDRSNVREINKTLNQFLSRKGVCGVRFQSNGKPQYLISPVNLILSCIEVSR
jgi:chemotaxis signal transduction protein